MIKLELISSSDKSVGFDLRAAEEYKKLVKKKGEDLLKALISVASFKITSFGPITGVVRGKFHYLYKLKCPPFERESLNALIIEQAEKLDMEIIKEEVKND